MWQDEPLELNDSGEGGREGPALVSDITYFGPTRPKRFSFQKVSRNFLPNFWKGFA